MKKYLYLAAFCLLLGPTVSAQNDADKGIEFPHRVVTNGFWDNWFVGVGAGVNVYGGQHDQHMSLGKRFAPAVNAYVGKWFTPGLGVRANYSGLYWNGVAISPETGFVRKGLGDGYHKQKGNFVYMHADVMLNLSEMFCGHNPQRAYSFIPYAGAGIIHSTSQPKNDELTWHAGIINRFRLSNAVDLNLELSATGLEGKFDGEHGGRPDYDGILGATLGVTYYFPTRGFQRPTPQIISEIELNQMRDQMNAMAAANMQLQQQLANAQQPVEVEDTEEVVITDPNIAPRTVFFKIGSDRLSPQEEMNLSYLANRIKEFPGTTYTINGYADSATGTPAFNEKLSLKRAQVVKDLLVKKYGIPADNLKVAAGGGVDKFGQPILNRVVLVESEK